MPMNFQIYAAKSTLHPYVKQYYYWEDDAQGNIPLPQHLFALGDQYIIFLQSGEAICKPANHASFSLPPVSVIGHFTHPGQLQLNGPVKMVVVQLNAYGCHRLTGMSMHTFTNYYRNLCKHNNQLWQQLSNTLFEGTTPDEIGSILDTALENALQQKAYPLKQVDDIADYVQQQNGIVSMESLSGKYGISRPTLERMFMEIIGIPPQLYARMMRFKTAMRSLQQMNFRQWQTSHYNFGYYNQTLFIKDHVLFNGKTPAPVESGSAAIAQMPMPDMAMQVAVAG